MKIAINNLYGIKDGHKAYYRKQGIYCFDFVNNIEYASELTQDEVDRIMKSADWYCKQYNASDMEVIG